MSPKFSVFLRIAPAELLANNSYDILDLCLMMFPQIFFHIINYNLHPQFRSRGEVGAYSNTNLPAARLLLPESPNFNVIWLNIYLPNYHYFPELHLLIS